MVSCSDRRALAVFGGTVEKPGLIESDKPHATNEKRDDDDPDNHSLTTVKLHNKRHSLTRNSMSANSNGGQATEQER